MPLGNGSLKTVMPEASGFSHFQVESEKKRTTKIGTGKLCLFFGTPVEHPERGPGSTGQADDTVVVLVVSLRIQVADVRGNNPPEAGRKG